jgi:hypothetical protein
MRLKNMDSILEFQCVGKLSNLNLLKDFAFDFWRHDTQHNDTQHNDTQHDDTQHNDLQHNNK